MSKLVEDIKTLFYDLEDFLVVTLVDTTLSQNASDKRDKLLKAIDNLRREWTQLQPEPEHTIHRVLSVEGAAETGGRDGDDDHHEDAKIPDISVADLDHPTRAGFLIKKKKGNILKIQRKKYFILHGAILYSFDKNTSKKPNWSRHIEHHQAKVLNESATKKEFQFEITCPNIKTLTFAASTEQDMKSWVAAINKEAGVDTGQHPAIETTNIHSDAMELSNEYLPYEDIQVTPSKPALPLIETTNVHSDAMELSDEYLPYEEVGDAPSKPSLPCEVDEDNTYDSIAQTTQRSAPSDEDSDGATYPTPPPPITDDDNTSDQLYFDPVFQPYADVDMDQKHKSLDDILVVYETPPEIPARNISTTPPIAIPPQRPLPTISSSHSPETNTFEHAALPPRTGPSGKNITIMGGNYYENLFYGVWKCQANNCNELEFSRGDIMEVISKKYGEKGWWVAKLNQKIGLVPYSYLSPAYQEICE